MAGFRPQHVFHQTACRQGLRERALIDGTPRDYDPFETRFAGANATKAARAKSALGRMLKQSARTIYMVPALILLRALPEPACYASVLLLVALVVVFFALLNAFIFCSWLTWRAADKGEEWTGHMELPFSRRGGDELDLMASREDVVDVRAGGLESSAQPDALVRARGNATLLAGRGDGEPLLLRDFWSTDSSPPWRLAEAMDFFIAADDQIPVIVVCESAPILIAPPEEHALEEMRLELSESAAALLSENEPLLAAREGVRVELCVGDEVEIVGVIDEILPDIGRFKLGDRFYSLAQAEGGGAAPYRPLPRGPGLLLRCTPERPVCLRVLGRS